MKMLQETKADGSHTRPMLNPGKTTVQVMNGPTSIGTGKTW